MVFYSQKDWRGSSPISTHQQRSPYPFHSSLPFPSAFSLPSLLAFVFQRIQFSCCSSKLKNSLPSYPCTPLLSCAFSFLICLFPLVLFTKFPKQCSRKGQQTNRKTHKLRKALTDFSVQVHLNFRPPFSPLQKYKLACIEMTFSQNFRHIDFLSCCIYP